MTREQIVERLRVVIVEETGDLPEVVTADAKFRDHPFWLDELQQVDLELAIECEFGIEITEADSERLVTVADAVDLVVKRLAARSHESGRPCGCDPGANWVCAEHRENTR